MTAVPPDVGCDRPLGGGVPPPVIGGLPHFGALRLPRPRPRPAGDLARRDATASRTVRPVLPRAIAVAGVLALLLAGAVAHFRSDTARREPQFAMDSIEAWLRYMTVTPASPPAPSPIIPPEGL